MLISVPEAAKVLGLTGKSGIYRKIKSGELPKVDGLNGQPMIERDGLEDVWDRITRKRRDSPTPARPAADRAERRASPPIADSDLPDFNEERARHEREKRLLAELTRQEKERELLRREDVMQAWNQAVNLTRVKLLGVPSTVKQRIPHLEVEEIEVITSLIREALEELAGGEVTA